MKSASALNQPKAIGGLRGADFLVGGASALQAFVYGATCAALVFSGRLVPYLNWGMQAAMLNAIIMGLVVAAASSLPFAIAGPDTRAGGNSGDTHREFPPPRPLLLGTNTLFTNQLERHERRD